MMTDRMLQFFAYDHLKDGALKDASRPFGELAQRVVDTIPANAERTSALRKLLEAKDCAVRAVLYTEPASPYPPRPNDDGNRHHEAKTAAMTGSAPHEGLMAEPTKIAPDDKSMGNDVMSRRTVE